MYMDSYVASGLIIVGLTCVFLAYVGFYAYRHIKKDMEQSLSQEHKS